MGSELGNGGSAEATSCVFTSFCGSLEDSAPPPRRVKRFALVYLLGRSGSVARREVLRSWAMRQPSFSVSWSCFFVGAYTMLDLASSFRME